MIDKAGARRADRTPGTDHPCGAGPWLPSSRRDCRRHPDSADQASVRQRSCRCSPRPPEGHAKESVTRFVRRDAPELVHRGGAPQAAIMSTSWWSSLCISFSLGFSPASANAEMGALGTVGTGIGYLVTAFTPIGGLLSVVPFHRRHSKDLVGPTPEIHPQTPRPRPWQFRLAIWRANRSYRPPPTRPGARLWLSDNRFGDSVTRQTTKSFGRGVPRPSGRG